RDTDVKYPQAFRIPDEAALADLLALSKDLGINLLDTAPAYGTSEERLGRLLKGQRNDWVISTKVGEHYVDGKSIHDFSAGATRKSVEDSLRALGTDWLDIVLVHANDDDTSVVRGSPVLDTLVELRDKGYIRCIGVSSKSVAGGLAGLERSDVIMVTCNLDDLSQLPVMEEAMRTNKGIMVKKALASGHAGRVRESLRFVSSQPGVATIVVGTINPDHLRANVTALIED
ncbi:MAG: aldo/keto reductase, partial [Pseudomonadales bacterium]|nr:aldo/keto reductase [Pseudomonadales bacterium]